MFLNRGEKVGFLTPLVFWVWAASLVFHSTFETVSAVLTPFRAVFWERPKTTKVWWLWICFFKYAPWCITCPLVFALCVASRSKFCGCCHFFQRVVLPPPGGMTQPFSIKECTVVHSFFRRSFVLVDEHIHGVVIKDISAVSWLGCISLQSFHASWIFPFLPNNTCLHFFPFFSKIPVLF